MKSIIFFAALGFLSISTYAQEATGLRKKHFNLSDGIAIKGYDPVAYFTQSKALKGSKDLALYHRALLIIFHLLPIKKLLKSILQNTNLNMAVGVLMLWVITEKKFRLTRKHLK